MADEIRVTREGTGATPPPAEVRPTTVDPERQLPAEAESATRVPEYDDPEEARADIEATRARLSSTIDEIEGVLVRKKEQIQSRLDVTAPIRANPWSSMGIALGAGLVLGLLTGGDDEDVEDVEDEEYGAWRYSGTASPAVRDWEHRTEILEERTRRLLAIAREQEEEIRRLRGKKKKRRDRESTVERVRHNLEDTYEDLAEGASEYAETGRSRLDDIRDTIESGIASFITGAIRQLTERR
jgi:ElaB/YqjD/DUF883 family membrane-anchored ribosome-binding protein